MLQSLLNGHAHAQITLDTMSQQLQTYSTLCIQSLLLQFLTTRLHGFRNVFLCHCVRIETLHHRNVLQRVPLQHPLLYVLPVNSQPFSTVHIRLVLDLGPGSGKSEIRPSPAPSKFLAGFAGCQFSCSKFSELNY